MTIRKFQYDDPSIGVVDTIMPPIKNESPQRSPYRHPTLQRNDGSGNASRTTLLGDDSFIGGPSSSLDTIRLPINHENPQLLPYSSATTLQSNGSIYNASFMTSPSYDTFFEVPTRNNVAQVCLPGLIVRSIVLSGVKDTSRGRNCRGYYKHYP